MMARSSNLSSRTLERLLRSYSKSATIRTWSSQSGVLSTSSLLPSQQRQRQNNRQQQQQQQRHPSNPPAALPLLSSQRSFSTAFAGISIPESLKETVKNTVLDHALKEDSQLWRSSNFDETLDQLDLSHLDDNNSYYYWPHLPPGVNPAANPVDLAAGEIQRLVDDIRNDMLSTEHPVLAKAASYFFQPNVAGGKKVRPMMLFLLARALADHYGTTVAPPYEYDDLLANVPNANLVRDLANVTEVYHTASLLHDDVLDDADQRRGVPALHTQFGSKIAVLAGDFLLARSCVILSQTRCLPAIEAMATVLENLVLGEVMQIRGPATATHASRLRVYLKKNYYKTASLMALSCQSVVFLGRYGDLDDEHNTSAAQVAYDYGKHIGMAFQLIDDALDYQGTADQLGKPAMNDLRAGLATAPVLFAAQEYPDQLNPLLDRKFKQPGDVEKAVELVFQTRGLERTHELAIRHAELAMDAILMLDPSPCRDALVVLAQKVIARNK